MCWITFLSTKTLVISQKSFRLSEAVNGFQTDISAKRVAIRSKFSVLMFLHFCKVYCTCPNRFSILTHGNRFHQL